MFYFIQSCCFKQTGWENPAGQDNYSHRLSHNDHNMKTFQKNEKAIILD